MSTTPNPKIPLIISCALVGLGLVLGLVGGVTSGSILGGIIAACGIIPSAYASWAGIQQETQTSLAGGILMIVVSLVVGGILLVLGIINAFL